jgi:hypothetical protein
MAEQAVAYHHGEMDVREQRSTFHAVIFATKWATLYLAGAILFLTMWFCTSAGFISALISAAVLVALGTLFLRQKPKTH